MENSFLYRIEQYSLVLGKKRKSVMLSIPEALLLPLGAGLLSSEFEKQKVQIIYGSLVGGHPPSAWLKSSPQGGLLGEDGKFYLDKNAHFSEVNSLALEGVGLAERNDWRSEASRNQGKRG
jgi:hypothetical protein